jgi:hypothetical protein
MEFPTLQVNCLRWQSSGVYACANETTATYSLGYATDPTQEFTPLWHRADTCRESCAPPSRLEMLCRQPWEMIAPMIGAADGGLCEASSPHSGWRGRWHSRGRRRNGAGRRQHGRGCVAHGAGVAHLGPCA